MRFLVPLLAAGCVIHTDDLLGTDDPGLDQLDLEVEPSSVEAGETAVLEVTDWMGTADFHRVLDVRPLGEFSITEWTADAWSLTLVVEVAAGATGEQPLALDFPDGTAITSFHAQ